MFSKENILKEKILLCYSKQRTWICKVELQSLKGVVIEQSDFLLQSGIYMWIDKIVRI